MANSSKKGLGLTQGNKNTHIFTDFELGNKEATQLKVLEAIKAIEINVGDIIVGDITVESNDTGTHTRLDTANGYLETSEVHLQKLDEMSYVDNDGVSSLVIHDEATFNTSAITPVTEIKYVKTRNLKDASVESWINNTTLTTGQISSSLDVTNFGRDSFISYNDSNTGDTTSIAIKSNGAIIGVLNPKDNPSGTYRFAYSHLNLTPFTIIELENWNTSSLDIVNVSVFSG